MRTLAVIPVTIRRFNLVKDEYNNDVRDVYTEIETKCWLAARKAGTDSENEVDRNQSKDNYALFFYGNYDIISTDQIFVDEAYSGTGKDMVLEIVGDPQRFRNRQGKINHIEVIGQIVNG